VNGYAAIIKPVRYSAKCRRCGSQENKSANSSIASRTTWGYSTMAGIRGPSLAPGSLAVLRQAKTPALDPKSPIFLMPFESLQKSSYSFRAAVTDARRHGDLYFAALLSQDRIQKAFGTARWLWQGWIYTPAVTVWVFRNRSRGLSRFSRRTPRKWDCPLRRKGDRHIFRPLKWPKNEPVPGL
jgi:hypothetical protein